MISPPIFQNDPQDCVCTRVQACTHMWERSGKVEGPPKYPAEHAPWELLEASCRASSDSFVTWSPVVLTCGMGSQYSLNPLLVPARRGSATGSDSAAFSFLCDPFLLFLRSPSYAASNYLMYCPFTWPHVTVHPVIFKSKVWMCLGHQHYFWSLITSMDVFIMNSLLPWSYFTGIKLTAKGYVFTF